MTNGCGALAAAAPRSYDPGSGSPGDRTNGRDGHSSGATAAARGRCARVIGVLLAALLCAGASFAQQTPTVAAASDLRFVLEDIARRFTEHGQPVTLVFGASGTLTRQIRDGAPFELFLAADEAFPAQLTARRTDPRRAAWSTPSAGWRSSHPPGSPLSPDPQLRDLSRLTDAGGVTRFAIANPDVAPYGRAAEAVLRKRGPVGPRCARGWSSATASRRRRSFATTGNAVGGLVAYSLVLASRVRRARHPGADSRPRPSAAAPAHGAAEARRRGGDGVLRVSAAGPAPGQILERHGFAVPD